MKKRKGAPIAALYAAPGIRLPGMKNGKDAYPHCYEEDEQPSVKNDGDGEVFKCVYASPEWFAAHHGLHDKQEGGSQPKNCPRCGAEVIEGANFCINCGFKLNGEIEA